MREELKENDHFNYLESVLTKDGNCTREMKMRIAMPKKVFNRKISLLTSKLNIKLSCYVWSIALYGSETWALRKLERKGLDSFEMWYWRRTEKITWSEAVTNDKFVNV
jgi:hypothetical protein